MRRADARRIFTTSPELAGVGAITQNPTFPPLWRLRAHRTYLPDQLAAQLREWKTWAAQVAHGEHYDYMRELHSHVTSDFLRHHWSLLRAAAIESLDRSANWANKPPLVEVRDRIIRLPEPAVSRARIDPSDRQLAKRSELDAQYVALFEKVREIVGLTRQWDSNVRGSKKVLYYENYYLLTLDEFKNQARSNQLLEFFGWAERCAQLGFGLFLDY